MYECRWLEQCLLGSDVLPDVRLVEGHDVHGVSVSAVTGGLSRHPETQREIIHAVHNTTLE